MSAIENQWKSFKAAYDKGADLASLQKQLVDLKVGFFALFRFR